MYRPVASLVAYERNSRTHTDWQIKQVADSIREFGWTNPILVDGENGVIAGHARVMAAMQMGMETVPVIELSHMTEAQKRAYVIADNQLALGSSWDWESLKLEIGELKLSGFDVGVLAFDDAELSLAGIGDEDNTPPEPEPQAAEDNTAYRTVAVHFKELAAVEAFFALIGQTFTDKTKFVWFPE